MIHLFTLEKKKFLFEFSIYNSIFPFLKNFKTKKTNKPNKKKCL